MKRPSALFFLFTLVAPALLAQSPAPSSASGQRPLSLEEAVRIAESQSEAVRIAAAAVMRAHGQQYQARSQRLPQLNGSGSYVRTLRSQYSGLFGSGAVVDSTKPKPPAPPCDAYLRDASATTTDRLLGLENASRCSLGGSQTSSFSRLPFGQKNQYNLGLSLSQNLFTGGRVSALNSVADAGRKAAEIELSAQRAQVKLDVTQSYYDAGLADRLLAISESSLAQTENVLRQTRLSHTVGNVSEFELLRAQVTSANQRPLVIQRRGERNVAYFRLKQLLNVPLDEAIVLTTAVDASLPATASVLSGGELLSDTSAADRASVREAAETVRAQMGQLRSARAQRFPTLSLVSQYGGVAYPLSGLPASSDFRYNWTVGVASQFPLFTGGRLRGEQMVAEANVRDARARYDQVRELAALDSRVAMNSFEQARAAWEVSSGTAEQAAKAYSIAEVRYREGLSTQLELNDSRILLEQSLANRALTARNFQMARVKLSLLPDLPLQSGNAGAGGAAAAAYQSQSAAASQQQSQGAAQQQTQQQTGIPPQ